MILRRRQARLSLIEQADWISEESPETADPFIDAEAASFSFLESNPVSGRVYEALVFGSLREEIREGLDSGPAEPLDMEAVKTEARKNLSKTK
jgi:hypothetical protein